MENVKQAILVATTDPTELVLIRQWVGEGREVLAVSSINELLDVCRSGRVDLFLLDPQAPGMGGYEACKKLKADPRGKSVPVLVILPGGEDWTHGLEAGVHDNVERPFNPPLLKARVQNCLELKHYRDYVENLSLTDSLTGLANRRRFDEYLDGEWRRGIRNRKPLSLLLLDLDFFKAFNETHGRLAGDECLRQFTQVLTGTVHRPGDLVARYGGEEFGCILPETDVVGALQVASWIEQRLFALRIPHGASKLTDHVTVSMGIASAVPSYEQEPAELAEQAEYFLIQAKQNGRNRIETALPEKDLPNRHVR